MSKTSLHKSFWRTFVRLSLLVTLCAGSAVSASAAEADFVGLLAMAVDEDVAQQIGLTDEVKSKLTELIDRRVDEAGELVLSSKDLAVEQRDKKLREFVAESEKLEFALLSAEQKSKLNQIRIADAGMLTLAEPEIADQLRLSDDQKKQVAELLAYMKDDLTKGGESQRRITRSKYERRLSDVLTRPQLTGWEMLAGIVDEGPRPEALVGDDTAPKETVTDEGKGDAGADEPKRTVRVPTAAANGKLRFNFERSPWEPVLKWFAEQAGYSLQMEPGQLLGTFTLVDENEYTPSEALDQINSVLLTQGYTLVRNKKQLMLINTIDDGIPKGIVPIVKPEELDERGRYETMKCLFTLDKLSIEELEDLADSIELLVDEDNGFISAVPESKQIIVMETGGNLRVIRSIIEKAEKEVTAAIKEVKIFKFEHASAPEFLKVAGPLLGIAEDETTNEDGTLTISTDPIGNRIIASGTAKMLQKFETIFKSIDVDPGDVDSVALDVPQIKVYSHRADPQSVLEVVKVMLLGNENVRAASDPATGNLIVMARQEQHDEVSDLLEKMQRDAIQFAVIPMRKYDVESMILVLNTFYPPASVEEGAEGESKSKGPIFTADLNTNKLIVRGTAAEIAAIQSLVDEIDPPYDANSDYPRKSVRSLPLQGLNADSLLREAELLWPNMRRENRISVKSTTPFNSGGLRTREIDPRRERLFEGEQPGELYRQRRSREGERRPAEQEELDKQPATQPASIKSASRRSSRLRVRHVAFQEEDPKKEATQPAQPQPPADTEPNADTNPAKGADGKPEITVTVTDSTIYFSSDDLDALDDFETLMLDIINQRGTAPTRPVVIYLKNIKAAEAKATLDDMLGLGSTSGGGGGAGGMLSGLIGGVGGDLLDGLMGGGDDLGGSTVQTTGDVQITAARNNMLIVQANEMDLELIEDVLLELDRSFAPQDPKEYGETFVIPIRYMTADYVANVVKQAFPQQIYTEGSGQQRQQQQTQQILQQMLRGGRAGRSGGQQQTAQEQKMSIGVDPHGNRLIVTGPEHLYLSVLSLVEQLDRRGIADNEGISIVTLKGNVNPTLLSNALQSILGDQVQANTLSADSTSTSGTSTTQPSTSGRTTTPPTRTTQPSRNPGEDFLRRIQDLNLRSQQLRRGAAGIPGVGTPGVGRSGFPDGGRGGGGRGGR